jgi:YbbR domain-containing protein
MRPVRWVTDNFLWKLLALAAAVAIWMLVASEPELSTFATVRLEFKNLPEDLEIGSEPVSTVSLELRGPSGELRSVSGEPYGLGSVRPAVILDMSGARPGERTFPIGNGNVRLARGVRLIRAIPSEVRFTFEHRATRSVPVKPRFSGLGSDGYVVAQVNVEPKQIEITGPTSHVARVNEAVTDVVDVSNVVGPSEFRVNAYVEDPFVALSGSPQVTVSVVMRKQ